MSLSGDLHLPIFHAMGVSKNEVLPKLVVSPLKIVINKPWYHYYQQTHLFFFKILTQGAAWHARAVSSLQEAKGEAMRVAGIFTHDILRCRPNTSNTQGVRYLPMGNYTCCCPESVELFLHPTVTYSLILFVTRHIENLSKLLKNSWVGCLEKAFLVKTLNHDPKLVCLWCERAILSDGYNWFIPHFCWLFSPL